MAVWPCSATGPYGTEESVGTTGEAGALDAAAPSAEEHRQHCSPFGGSRRVRRDYKVETRGRCLEAGLRKMARGSPTRCVQDCPEV